MLILCVLGDILLSLFKVSIKRSIALSTLHMRLALRLDKFPRF